MKEFSVKMSTSEIKEFYTNGNDKYEVCAAAVVALLAPKSVNNKSEQFYYILDRIESSLKKWEKEIKESDLAE